MKHRPLILLLVALALPSRLVAEPEPPPGLHLVGGELEPLRSVAIQDGGRSKPLDTFARETARRVAGAKPFGFQPLKGLHPLPRPLALPPPPTPCPAVHM